MQHVLSCIRQLKYCDGNQMLLVIVLVRKLKKDGLDVEIVHPSSRLRS